MLQISDNIKKIQTELTDLKSNNTKWLTGVNIKSSGNAISFQEEILNGLHIDYEETFIKNAIDIIIRHTKNITKIKMAITTIYILQNSGDNIETLDLTEIFTINAEDFNKKLKIFTDFHQSAENTGFGHIMFRIEIYC